MKVSHNLEIEEDITRLDIIMKPPGEAPKTVEDVFNKLKILEAEEKASAFTASIKEREPAQISEPQEEAKEEAKEPERKVSRFKMERMKK